MNTERSRWIKTFYKIYGELQKKHILRMSGRFGKKKNQITIYEIKKDKRTLFCKVEDENETQCYKNAAQRLIEHQKRETI